MHTLPPTLPPTHLLYLHGFRSSPQSAKARLMGASVQTLQQQGLDVTWHCPQLPPSPARAVAELQALVADWPRERMAVIGSSLGGFYAAVLAEALGCRAALINPAVAPARDLARQIGEQTAFHDPGASFFFREEFIAQFAALNPFPIRVPQRYWALITQGDEVLDWREMAAHCDGSELHLLAGSDHAVSDFDVHLPALLNWLGLSCALNQARPVLGAGLNQLADGSAKPFA
jgi:predicted esterase YcpF (UPF0227 family)